MTEHCLCRWKSN